MYGFSCQALNLPDCSYVPKRYSGLSAEIFKAYNILIEQNRFKYGNGYKNVKIIDKKEKGQ